MNPILMRDLLGAARSRQATENGQTRGRAANNEKTDDNVKCHHLCVLCLVNGLNTNRRKRTGTAFFFERGVSERLELNDR